MAPGSPWSILFSWGSPSREGPLRLAGSHPRAPASTRQPVKWGSSGERTRTALQGRRLSCSPWDRVHRRPGTGHQRQGLLSFLPQLVTQGSSVHGLSNKLNDRIEAAVFLPLSLLDLPCLCCGMPETWAVTGYGPEAVGPATFIGGDARGPAHMYLPEGSSVVILGLGFHAHLSECFEPASSSFPDVHRVYIRV